MNEMIIEGKFINIKEDIAILNDEVDNYIENVLSTKEISTISSQTNKVVFAVK